MQLEVYVDVLFFWNVIMNLVLLFITKTLRRQKTSWIRLISGAFFGALMSCILAVYVVLPSYINLLISYGCVGILMILIVFGKKNKKAIINNYIYFVIVTFIVGGMLQSLVSTLKSSYLLSKFYNQILQSKISILMLMILICTMIPVMLIILARLKREAKEERCYYKVILKLDETCIQCKGFLDTGNSLYDPLNGSPVILIDRMLLHNLYEEIVMNRPEKIRLIPYRCIGKENGLLEGIRFDEVTIENEQDSYTRNQITVAMSEFEFKDKESYQILLHSKLLGNF